jgi:arylformamidase
MKREDYPPQEPLSEAGERYGDECWRRGAGVQGEEFAYGDDPYQRLLVFRAPRPEAPVLVFWHGGGWTSGYKEWMAFMAPALTAGGVTLVSPGYRLAPRHVFPTGFEDCARAVKWTLEHLAPRRLFLGGHSAGGHYAALLAVRGDWQAALGVPRAAIAGCLPVSGVFDFTEGSGLSARPRFLGPEGSGAERDASPLHRLEPPLPPFLLAHGDQDFPHLMRQAETFEAALRSRGVPVERLVLAGRNHFGASYVAGEPDGPWVLRALRFMSS